MPIDVAKVVIAATLAFLVGIAMTPRLTYFLYARSMWKKTAGKIASTGEVATVFNSLHADKETKTPRLGGIIVWAATLATALTIWLLARFTSVDLFDKLDFISRGQTWIPLSVLLVGALVGLVDDLLEIRWRGDGSYSRGLSLSLRLAFVGIVGLAVGAWFYGKLGISTVGIPLIGSFDLGLGYVIALALITIGLYAGGVIDGLDGLAGGVFSIAFGAYSVIAFSQGQVDLAAFCATVAGATLAFLWFNVPPARFYLSETGSMPLTITLGVVAFMADVRGEGSGISVLPIIAFPLIATAASSLIQVLSKKIRGKKLFRVAPLHHHFEALGWPREKVVMRYWIISIVCALVAIIVSLVANHAK